METASGPLGATIAGANVHDTKLLAATLETIVVKRPPPTAGRPQHFCLDKGYGNPSGDDTVAAYQCTPISGISARKSSLPTVRRPIWRAAGCWNGRRRGSQSAGASPSAMRKRPSVSYSIFT